jgi:DNA-binding transcriptional LysR family regulator
MRIVGSSNMLLTMSETFARRANLWFDNQILPVPFDAPGIDTYLYWHANTDADPANRWFRDVIQSSVSEAESG